MEKPKKKASNPPKDVSSSTMKTEDNQIGKVPLFSGNLDVWKIRMRNFLMAQGVDVWELVITNNMMNGESKEYDVKAMKEILNGLPYSIKANLEKCSSAKGIWDKLHDLHSKGTLIMTTIKKMMESKKEIQNPSRKLKIRVMTSRLKKT